MLTGAVAGRLDAERVLLVSVTLVACSMIALGLAPSFLAVLGWGLFGAVFCLGVCVSGLFPALAAYAVDSAPGFSAPVNALTSVSNSTAVSCLGYSTYGSSTSVPRSASRS